MPTPKLSELEGALRAVFADGDETVQALKDLALGLCEGTLNKLESWMILVLRRPDGSGHVLVLENGILVDEPMQMATVAAEASRLVTSYAGALARARVLKH